MKREKGKIPHAEWPAIRARRARGEALASIARDYGCTAPAIRYIVRRGERANDVLTPQLGSTGAAVPPTPGGRAAALPREGRKGRGRRPLTTSSLAARVPSRPAPALLTAVPEVREEDIARSRDGAARLAEDLRTRVISDIAPFLVAIDAAFERASPETFGTLREATNRLMRAAARTLIEIDRVEEASAHELGGATAAGRGARRRS
jgi:hypothetical protein